MGYCEIIGPDPAVCYIGHTVKEMAKKRNQQKDRQEKKRDCKETAFAFVFSQVCKQTQHGKKPDSRISQMRIITRSAAQKSSRQIDVVFSAIKGRNDYFSFDTTGSQNIDGGRQIRGFVKYGCSVAVRSVYEEKT